MNLYTQNKKTLQLEEFKSRINTQSGQINEFTTYKTWRDCLIDYSYWQLAYGNNLSDGEYIDFLDKVYSPGENYGNKIKELLKQTNATK